MANPADTSAIPPEISATINSVFIWVPPAWGVRTSAKVIELDYTEVMGRDK
jgi:hypothetical protein